MFSWCNSDIDRAFGPYFWKSSLLFIDVALDPWLCVVMFWWDTISPSAWLSRGNRKIELAPNLGYNHFFYKNIAIRTLSLKLAQKIRTCLGSFLGKQGWKVGFIVIFLEKLCFLSHTLMSQL